MDGHYQYIYSIAIKMILTMFAYVKQVPDSYNYGNCKGCILC